MVKRYPHTALVSWKTEPTKDPLTGRQTDGQPVSFAIRCRVETAKDRKYSNRDGDAEVEYQFKVFPEKLDQDIPDSANMIYKGKTFPIIKVIPLQANTVILI